MKQLPTASPRAPLGDWLDAVRGPRAFAALAELFPDAAVFAVDRDRTVVFWSEGAERLLGFSADEMVGEHCLKGSRCPECIAGCGLETQGVIEGAALSLYRKDGALVRVTKQARSFYDDDGRFLGGLEVLLPVTEENSAARALPLLESPEGGTTSFHGIVTRDEGMRQLFATVVNVARTDTTVLVRGESGSGKELLARAIHEESHRKEQPFLAINCAAMSASLLESELFGHEKGAFTGAVGTHKGVFERAHGGTLFLDEVAELPLELQAKLLRVLEDRTFYRVGGSAPIQVDVRIISATHRSLRAEVAKGRFREDLMYRLRVVPIFLPALRERRGDIPLLIDHFVEQLNARGHRKVREVSGEALKALLDHPWPGNVRELRNVIEYAFAVGSGPSLTRDELPPELSGREPSAQGPKPLPPPPVNGAAERQRIQRALEEADGHIGRAAELLGVSRPTLWRWRKKHGL